MPAYRYRAVQPLSGRIMRGQIAAANEYELAQHLNSTGLELIEAQAKKEARHKFHWPRRIPPRSLPLFCTHMADLLKAGIAFADAVRDVTEATEQGPMRDALTDITRSIHHGSRIAAAFSRHTRLFSDVFTSILSAGETSGDLTRTFARLAHYAETRARNTEQTRRALRYPLFMLTVALGATGFMMTMVVPQILQFLNSIDSELPLSTRILVTVSDIFAQGWWVFLLALVMLFLTLSTLRRTSERARYLIDAFVLHLPFVGSVLRRIALARFMNSFAILYESGIGILASLRSAKATLGNRALAQRLDGAERQILAGRSLSVAMEDILPVFGLRMIRVGEQSGALGKSLNDIAAMQDRDLNAMTERMIGALEPMLTLLVGLLLAWVVMAVLGPIYGNLGKLGTAP